MTYTVDAMFHDARNARQSFSRYDDAYNYFKTLIFRGAGMAEITDKRGNQIEHYSDAPTPDTCMDRDGYGLE